MFSMTKNLTKLQKHTQKCVPLRIKKIKEKDYNPHSIKLYGNKDDYLINPITLCPHTFFQCLKESFLKYILTYSTYSFLLFLFLIILIVSPKISDDHLNNNQVYSAINLKNNQENDIPNVNDFAKIWEELGYEGVLIKKKVLTL
jgi:hypothetical protein